MLDNLLSRQANPMPSPEQVTKRLGGNWYGQAGSAPCPICQPERRADQRALSIAAGHTAPLLLHCWKRGCSYAQIAQALGIRAGEYSPPHPAELARREAEKRAEAKCKAAQALRCWQEARPIEGTIAETYLRQARGITCPLPPSLRYHPACYHGGTAQCHPALVARVEGGGSFAVHRTYLRSDGKGKAAIEPAKAMLGAVAGGAVRLTGQDGALVVAEGIETALSLACGLLPGSVAVTADIRAALSASGMDRLILPDRPGHLILAPDGDDVGRTAARSLAQRAVAAGWSVTQHDPGDGRDFNDVLIAGGKA